MPARPVITSACILIGCMLGSMLALSACAQAQEPSLAFCLYLAFPWVLPVALLPIKALGRGLAIAIAPMLALEAVSYFDTFMHVTASTAALVYLVKPVLQLGWLAIALGIAWMVRSGKSIATRKHPG